MVQFDGDVRGPFGERKLGPALQANDDVTVEVIVFPYSNSLISHLRDWWIGCDALCLTLSLSTVDYCAAGCGRAPCGVPRQFLCQRSQGESMFSVSRLDLALSQLLADLLTRRWSLWTCRRAAQSIGLPPACPCGPSFRSVSCLEATLRVSDLLTLLLGAVVSVVAHA